MKNLLSAVVSIVAVFAVDAQVPPPAPAPTCMECKGTGRVPYFFGFSKRCATCGGTGLMRTPHPPKPVAAPQPQPPQPKPAVRPHNAAPRREEPRRDNRMDAPRNGGARPQAQPNRQSPNGNRPQAQPNRQQQQPQGNGGQRPPQR